MTLSLEELTTPLTRQQIESSIYGVLAAVGVSTTSWKSGSPVRTMITGVAVLGTAFSRLNSNAIRSGFLSLASGDWLKVKAREDFGVIAEEATFATGEITLVNSGGGIYLLDPDDVVVRNPTTGKTYRNTAAISIGSGATVTEIPIQAEEAGSDSTSAPDEITDLVTTLLGVTVTNPLAVVGQDAESDPEIKIKCNEKLGSLSPNGPWDAYSYAARTAVRDDGSLIGVTRTRVSKDGFGNLTLHVATATGGLVPADVAVVDDAIQRRAAPLAVTALAVSAGVLTVPVTYSVWMYNTTGLTVAEIEDAIALNLVAFMTAQPIGGNEVGGVDPGKVFLDAIRTAIGSTFPQIFHVVVTLPAADVELTTSQIPVLGTLTPTAINQVAPSAGY